jgi:hypothetical protein
MIRRRPLRPLRTSLALLWFCAPQAVAQTQTDGAQPTPSAAQNDQEQPPPVPQSPASAPETPADPAKTVLLPGDAPISNTPEAKPTLAAKDTAGELRRTRQRQLAETAHVHLYVNYENAWLEIASLVDDHGFRRVCPAPCDVPIRVTGKQARVVAPGMTPSNPFRIEPGQGTAQFRVDGGSQSTRKWGILSMAIGAPVALSGMGLWGWGKIQESKGLQTTGIVVASVGAVAIIGSLPLLASGSTRVRNERGHTIARRGWSPAF